MPTKATCQGRIYIPEAAATTACHRPATFRDATGKGLCGYHKGQGQKPIVVGDHPNAN